jgi:hypothetical protein
MRGKILLAILLTVAPTVAVTAPPPPPTGLWLTQEAESEPGGFLVRISLLSGKLWGRIEEVRDPAQRAARCKDCPGSRKGQLLMGLTILQNARFNPAANAWEDGIILEPETGSLRSVEIVQLPGDRKLEVKRSAGIFYSKSIWTRVE